MIEDEQNKIIEEQIKRNPSVLSGKKYLGAYLLTLLYSAFIFAVLSRVVFHSNYFNHLSRSLFLAMGVAGLFAVYAAWGVNNSARSESFKDHVKALRIMVGVGLIFWTVSQVTKLEFIYQIYIVWSIPLLDYIRDNRYLGKPVLNILMLLLLLFPGISYLTGVAFARSFSGYDRRTLGKAILLIPVLFLALFSLSFAVPSMTLFSPATYPRVDGATAAIPLGQILAQELTGMSVYQAKSKLRFHTTHNAYINLIERKTDVIFVAAPSDEEQKMAKAQNVRLRLTPVGKDAFVFLVHRNNPMNNLTIAQIQAIYSASINNWSNIGGANSSIAAYQRENNSGSQTYMENKVMKDVKLSKAPTERMERAMDGMITVIADYRNAQNSIGYSFYYYANEMQRNESVKFLSIEGVPCNKETIRTGTYPFTAVLYAVTREDEQPDSATIKLVNWLSTDAGQHAVERGGFIPMSQ